VTPEIATMPWTPGTRLVAADESRAMIRGVWPGAPLGHLAVCARWEALPLADGTRHVVIGDGCLSALTAPRYDAMVRSLRRVLRPRGLLLLRFFTRPRRPEAPAQVFDDLLAGRIGNFHVFKWRLAMALHAGLSEGVRLADIWEAWHAAVPRPDELARTLGWPLPVILTIDDFHGLDARYTFPTLGEAREAMAAGFREVACHFPAYELGERCPILAFHPR
jgi:SAM-dependent methyltransferase